MSKITFDEIKLFLTVAKYKNFSKASEELFISQPTVTKWIQHLEKEIGIQLLNRTSKSVALTESGEYLYDKFSILMGSFDAAIDSAKEIAGISPVSINVGALHGYEFDEDLENIIKIYSKKNPQLVINFEVYNLSELNRKVNSLDFIFTNNLELDYLKGFQIRELSNVELCLAVGKEHHLANKRIVAMEDIIHETYFVLSEDNSNSSMKYASDLFPIAAAENKLIPVSNVQSQMMNVAWNKGVALVSHSLIQGYEKDIHMIHIKDLPLTFKKIVAYKKSNLTDYKTDFLKTITAKTVFI